MPTPIRAVSFLRRLDALPARSVAMIAALLGVLVVLADVATGHEISFSIFYVGPIALVTWRLGRTGGAVAALVGALAWYGGEVIGGRSYSQSLIPLWNGLVRLAFFVIIVLLLAVLHELLLARERESRADPLTGSLNRRGFVERADAELARARRRTSPITVACFDLDRFKQLNDSAGHAAGDALLRAVASRVAGMLRPTDLVGRMGGDEFAVLLPDTDATAAQVVIARLRAGFEQLAGETGVGLSLGVVTFEQAPLDLAIALDRADRLMYAAKESGRAVHCAVEPAVDPIHPG